MSFKTKHLILAGGLLTMAASCQKKTPQEKVVADSGLLDPRPQETRDEYGTKVIISHVNVPIYGKDGEPANGQMVLTRGVPSEKYKDYQQEGKLSLHYAHLNGAGYASLVMADENGAINTTDGFNGLFVEGGKVILVAPENVAAYVNERRGKTSPVSKRITAPQPVKTPEIVPDTTAVADSTAQQKDSVKSASRDSVPTFNEQQFLDTLSQIRKQYTE